MTYMRPQLMEDIYSSGNPETPLSREQQEFLERIRRPQLQEDVYHNKVSPMEILPED